MFIAVISNKRVKVSASYNPNITSPKNFLMRTRAFLFLCREFSQYNTTESSCDNYYSILAVKDMRSDFTEIEIYAKLIINPYIQINIHNILLLLFIT